MPHLIWIVYNSDFPIGDREKANLVFILTSGHFNWPSILPPADCKSQRVTRIFLIIWNVESKDTYYSRVQCSPSKELKPGPVSSPILKTPKIFFGNQIHMNWSAENGPLWLEPDSRASAVYFSVPNWSRFKGNASFVDNLVPIKSLSTRLWRTKR